MPRTPKPPTSAPKSTKSSEGTDRIGNGGELHQGAARGGPVMTTAQGVPLSDDARGYGAHGRLEALEVIPELTRAALFQKRGTIIEAFVRFSTVAGNMGSPDLARDVRGFAVKLSTSEGNWDIVGNNMPVFFIQDASSSSTGSRAKACSRSSGTKWSVERPESGDTRRIRAETFADHYRRLRRRRGVPRALSGPAALGPRRPALTVTPSHRPQQR